MIVASNTVMHSQFVVFQVGSEAYGLPISQVQEVIRSGNITQMPRMPASQRGIIRLRDSVIPVVSLRLHFGLSDEDNEERRIVIVDGDGGQLGLEVDGVHEVLEIGSDQVEQLHSAVSSRQRAFIQGVAKMDEQLIILLDINQLFSGEDKEKLLATAE